MTGKPITWDEIDEIFSRCGEIHLSPNLAEGLEAQGIDTRSATDAKRRGPKGESRVGNADAPKDNRHDH